MPDEGTPMPAEVPSPELQLLIDQLQKGSSCRKRKDALIGLRQLGDVRSLPALKRARYRASGWMGRTNANSCLVKELRATVKELEEKAGRTAHSGAPLAP
jgi:hypothetical protein